MIKVAQCGSQDIVWNKDWWYCPKCDKKMPPEYENNARGDYHFFKALMKRKPANANNNLLG
jgi:hypothetical protein